MKGKVKRIIRERGFGFITTERGNEIFFHRSALIEGDFDSLREGTDVEFEVTRGQKGPRAVNMRVIR